MITFDNEARIFHITTENTSYVMRLKSDYVLEHLYYGKRLDNISGIGFRAIENAIGFSARNSSMRFSTSSVSEARISASHHFMQGMRTAAESQR